MWIYCVFQVCKELQEIYRERDQDASLIVLEFSGTIIELPLPAIKMAEVYGHIRADCTAYGQLAEHVNIITYLETYLISNVDFKALFHATVYSNIMSKNPYGIK